MRGKEIHCFWKQGCGVFSKTGVAAAQNHHSQSLASVLLDTNSTRWEQTPSPESGSQADAVPQRGVRGVRAGVNGCQENGSGQVLLRRIAPCWCENKARM